MNLSIEYVHIHPMQTGVSDIKERIENDGYLEPRSLSKDEESSNNSMF